MMSLATALDHESDCNSVDTDDAFMDMLGFSASTLPTTLDVEEASDEDTRGARHANERAWPIPHPTAIHCTPIHLPPKCSRYHLDPTSCLAVVLDDMTSLDQCQSLIQMSSKGFRYITEATHKAPDGTSYPIQIQNPNPHKLSAIDTRHDPQSTIPTSRPADPETALLDDLYSKIFTHLRSHPSYQHYVKRTKCGEMQGLNPRMRILKYDAKDNDRFEAHFDATTYVSGKSQRRKSLITMLLYLNDGDGEDFEGGETLYLDYHDYAAGKPNYENAVKVVPKAGRVAIFEHDLYHSGAPLGRGTKYIMRTDILFNAKEDCDEEVEEGTPKNINTEIVTDEDHKVVILVSDICKEIQLKSEDVEVLSDMDLLDSTCEALIAPGTTIMQQLLLDGGIAPIFVNSLIERAIAAVKK